VHRLTAAASGATLAALAAIASAHTAGGAPHEDAGPEAWLVVCLALALVLYVAGLARLWHRAGAGRGIGAGSALAFAGGWLVLVVALASPLDALADEGFRFHMIQHELLMVVAAPLLVAGRPLAAWTWALPGRVDAGIGAALRARWWQFLWRCLTAPATAWALHALALWLWHAPRWFDAALASRPIHEWEHASFLATALLFWWTLIGRRHGAASGVATGTALASLFTTMLHTGALGALLTFAGTPLYASYRAMAAGGLTALEDQQLGGLVMWVPAGLVYVGFALAFAGRALTARPALRSQRPTPAPTPAPRTT
jgi:putative membrane protein